MGTAVLSVLLGIAGVALGLIGGIAWVTPRQEPVQVTRNASVELQPTPWFDPGSTVFSSATSTGASPSPDDLQCTVLVAGQPRQAPLHLANAEELGSRVRDGVSLQPVLTLGRTGADARLVCQGRHVEHAAVWVMPTLPSRSPAAMSVVVAAVGCLGLALLVNPRARGFTAR